MPQPAQEQPKKLTYKQQRFVDAYVGEARANGTKAAIIAGYSERSARLIASENLTKPDIQQAISERVSEYAMSPAEVLAEYADIARNSLIKGLIEIVTKEVVNPITGESKVVSRPYHEFLDDEGRLKPQVRFVKSLKVTEGVSPSVAVELLDRMAALDRLAKYHGLQVERQEVAGDIVLRVIYDNGTGKQTTDEAEAEADA